MTTKLLRLSRTTLELLGIGLLSISMTVAAASAQRINFAAAIHYALTTNPQIIASQAKLEAAHAAKAVAQSAGLVKMQLESSYGRTNNPLSVFGAKLAQGQATFADFGANQYTGPSTLNVAPDALNNPGYYNNFNTGVALNIPVFQGGANLAAVKQAHALLSAAWHGNQQAKTELIYTILQHYEGAHAAQALVAAAQTTQQAALKYLQMSKQLYQQAVVLESDVLMAETNLRNATTALTLAKAEQQNQLDAFRILLGKPQSELQPGEPVTLALPTDSVTQLVQRAVTANAKLLTLNSQAKAAHSAIAASQAAYLPAVDVQLRHDWNADTVRLAKGANAVLVKMSWQLFSSGEQTATVRQAAALDQAARANVDHYRQELQLTITKLVRANTMAVTQLQAGARNLAQLKQIISTLTTRYGQGLAPLGQLLDAQARLDAASAQQIMQRYQRVLIQGQLLSLINELGQ